MAFRIGIIGCGAHATKTYGPALVRYARETPNADLVACCSRSAARATLFQKRFGFKQATTNVNLLLAQSLDVICLVVPVQALPDLASQILDSRVPLLIEKPPATTAEQGARLAELAERTRVPNRVAFNRRYHPALVALCSLLGRHRPGQGIHHISYELLRVGRTDADFSFTAIHAIDAARYIAGADYQRLSFAYHDMPEVGPHVFSVYAHGTFVSGATVTLVISPAAGLRLERATVHLAREAMFANLPMWVEPIDKTSLVHLANNSVLSSIRGEDFPSDPVESRGFYPMIASFFDELRLGRYSGDCALPSAVQSLSIADCIRARQASFCASQVGEATDTAVRSDNDAQMLREIPT